jgi:hypothetical protein
VGADTTLLLPPRTPPRPPPARLPAACVPPSLRRRLSAQPRERYGCGELTDIYLRFRILSRSHDLPPHPYLGSAAAASSARGRPRRAGRLTGRRACPLVHLASRGLTIAPPFSLSQVLSRPAKLGAGADIWGLGCLLYHVCVLRAPFEVIHLPAIRACPPIVTGICRCGACASCHAKYKSALGRGSCRWTARATRTSRRADSCCGESKRLVIGPPWLQLTSECQRF